MYEVQGGLVDGVGNKVEAAQIVRVWNFFNCNEYSKVPDRDDKLQYE